MIETLRDLYAQELDKARRDMESRLADELQTSIQGRMSLVRQQFDGSRKLFEAYDAELDSLGKYELFLLTLEGRLLPGFLESEVSLLRDDLLEHCEKAIVLWRRIAADASQERASYCKTVMGLYFDRMKGFDRRYKRLAGYYARIENDSRKILLIATNQNSLAPYVADGLYAELRDSMCNFRLP